ncbi:MAG TPA: bifunctional riboflavin kinase/FAD synthetase [Saprospiraceae bacterium]|nr:bifunctional riboflavin kinase/FAD synthetase [Saprospiraceae bacterium]
MQIHKGIDHLPVFKNAVVTIGSFDGVHRGHTKILERIHQLTMELNGESVLVTFDPHPRKVIYPQDHDLPMINTLEEKLELFESANLDHVVIVPFTVEFSQLAPGEYIEKFLVSTFHPAVLVIGYDHRFGLNRKGDIYLLKKYADRFNFQLIEIKKQEIDDITISSTKIRNALSEGDVQTANLFLGYHYTLSGKVVHGDKIGKQLGFPTANLSIPDKNKLIPRAGVYASRVVIGSDVWEGMLYIGDRPTLNTRQKISLEVHLFNFNEEIYDMDIRIQLINYIREDVKFRSLNDLRLQLQKDAESSLSVLKNERDSKRKSPEISIIILNFNGVEFLEAYLPSIVNSCPDYGEIIVADNGSKDESVDFLEEWYPDVKVLTFEKNFGFADGYNRAIAKSDAPYVLILNSDVKLENHSVEVLYNAIKDDPGIAGIQPLIMDMEFPDRYEYAGAAGGYIDWLAYPFCRGRIFKSQENLNEQYSESDIFWASGACMLIRRDVFLQLGGFDSTYFAHQEEIDYCWRALRAGYRFKVTDKAKAYHLGGGTLAYNQPRKLYLNFRNNLTTLLKNESWYLLVFILPIRLILDGVAVIAFLFTGKIQAAFFIIKAYFHVIARPLSLMRKVIQNNRLIKKYRIGKRNDRNRPVFSIVFSYYLKGKKKYSQL